MDNSPLGRLPPELRDEIYAQYFSSLGGAVFLQKDKPFIQRAGVGRAKSTTATEFRSARSDGQQHRLALLSVCKEVREDALSYVYSGTWLMIADQALQRELSSDPQQPRARRAKPRDRTTWPKVLQPWLKTIPPGGRDKLRSICFNAGFGDVQARATMLLDREQLLQLFPGVSLWIRQLGHCDRGVYGQFSIPTFALPFHCDRETLRQFLLLSPFELLRRSGPHVLAAPSMYGFEYAKNNVPHLKHALCKAVQEVVNSVPKSQAKPASEEDQQHDTPRLQGAQDQSPRAQIQSHGPDQGSSGDESAWDFTTSVVIFHSYSGVVTFANSSQASDTQAPATTTTVMTYSHHLLACRGPTLVAARVTETADGAYVPIPHD